MLVCYHHGMLVCYHHGMLVCYHHGMCADRYRSLDLLRTYLIDNADALKAQWPNIGIGNEIEDSV